ncbi:MAG: hypothetical protein ACXAEN_27385 [Candidatus Thorarchaeota archaeon]|jgi:hypothetical protein
MSVAKWKGKTEQDVVRMFIDRANSILSLVNMYQDDRDFKELVDYVSSDVDDLTNAINFGYEVIYDRS